MIEWWGRDRFPFARIERNGVHVGYGVTCARHCNANGLNAKTPCKKSLQIGQIGITEQEARLRLKRWVVMGKIGKLKEGLERQSHIACGGTQLSDLASGVCGWSELDPDLDILLATM